MSVSATLLEWACAVSITSASTPALINSLDLFSKSLSTPIAAATLNLPRSSLLEIDLVECLFISLTYYKVINIINDIEI